MGIRRKGRELALQLLYQADVTSDPSPAALELALSRLSGSDRTKNFARRLARGVLEHRAEIDRILAQSSRNWRLSRMAKVDLNILRIATYEMLHCPDIPLNVSIDEALEVSKRYGSEESPPFINGVLDQVAVASGAKHAVAAKQ
jgi:N utilization substance protein B